MMGTFSTVVQQIAIFALLDVLCATPRTQTYAQLALREPFYQVLTAYHATLSVLPVTVAQQVVKVAYQGNILIREILLANLAAEIALNVVLALHVLFAGKDLHWQLMILAVNALGNVQIVSLMTLQNVPHAMSIFSFHKVNVFLAQAAVEFAVAIHV